PARRGQRQPHLALGRPLHRAAQPHVPARRRPALRPPGGLAGFPARLAAVGHLQQVAGTRGSRHPLRTGRITMTTAHPSPDSAGADPAGTGPAGAGPTGADPAAPAGTSPAGTTTDPEYYIVARTIAAAPPEVFALLTDPARHHETEPTDWVRGALEPDPAPVTEVGQVFGIEMFHENAGG